MSDPILVVKGLSVEYSGQMVLEVEQLAVQRREILTLVGPNGSGKSTLLKVLGLLERPKRGEVWFDGARVPYQPQRLLELRRRMAIVFQAPLLCDATVAQNVALGLKLRRLPSREIDRRVGLWLDRLGISHLKDRPARRLSGGEAQRTSLARAFVLEPEVLLLDEPFAALDPPAREALLAEFQEILAEARTTTVFVTHDRGEAFNLGDRVAVLLQGRVAQMGSPEEVFCRPASEEVAWFVGVETVLPGQVVSCKDGLAVVDIGPTTVEVEGDCCRGDPVCVCLRPEDITLCDGSQPSWSGTRNVLEGKVAKTMPSGPYVRVIVDCGVPIVALVTRPSFRNLDLGVGKRVVLSFRSAAAHLIRRAVPLPPGEGEVFPNPFPPGGGRSGWGGHPGFTPHLNPPPQGA